MALCRRRAPPEQVLDEAPKEVPPQGEAAPAGGYDQFTDALWASFQQRFVQQYQEQPREAPAAEVGGGSAGSWAERFMRFNPTHYKGSVHLRMQNFGFRR